MKVSPHTHVESPLTGSTIPVMVARAKEMGRTHFAYTDQGHLSSALKVYSACNPSKDKKAIEKFPYLKNALKFIPGIEIYFKDSKCDIISGTKADRCKYFTATVYAENQAVYQELCKMVSRTDMPTIPVRGETQQLWSWANLQELVGLKVNIVLSGVHCMVAKPMLAGEPKAGQAVLDKLITMFGADGIRVALLCEPWTKKWANVIKINYLDGTSDSLLASDLVTTDCARNIKAMDLVERHHHKRILSKSVARMHYTVEKDIDKVSLHKGFLPLPGGDASLKANKFLMALAQKSGLDVLVSDYAYYANKEDKIVQTMRLEGNDKLQPNLHMKTTQEIDDYLISVMGLNHFDVDKFTVNNDRWAALFDKLELKYDWRLAKIEGNALNLAMDIIRKQGRMQWNNPMWVDRLKYELNVIAKNPVKDLTPYFLPIVDVLNHYIENGELPGPGRGSAGGSLFCYLLGITAIDPFEYDLPFDRFFSMERILLRKLPDIDVDLEGRELLVGPDDKSGYLYGRYGDKAAQISTRTTIRLKSAIKATNRYFNGKVEKEIETFTEGLPAPPQGVSDLNFVFGYEDDEGTHIPGLIEQSDSLRDYVATRPQEWEIVSKAMGLTSAFSRHACAIVLSDIPIKDIIPTKEGTITQYEAKECEAAGLIKYDFLTIEQLKDIRVCMDLINKKNGKYRAKSQPTDEVGWWHPESDCGVCSACEKPEENSQVELVDRQNTQDYMVCDTCKTPFKDVRTGYRVGYFDHKNTKTDIWKLPSDLSVFQSVWDGDTETIFQINSRSMIPVVMQIKPKSIMDLSNILALVRPGPLDFIDVKTGRNMVEEYICRLQGTSEPDIPELFEILPESFGIIIYQEQLGKIAKNLAGFSNSEAEILRENMAKKRMVELAKMKPQFMEGATKNVPHEIAETIWERMVTFGRYGFSVIHAAEYALITYASMFLKYHYNLEWWAAVLTNAKEKEITGKFWPHVKDKVLPPDINLSGDSMVVDYTNGKIRSKLGIIRGIGDKTIEPIVSGRPYADIQDFVNKGVAGQSLINKLIHVGVLDSLFPSKLKLYDKLKMFADAEQIRSFNEKVAKAKSLGKKMRALQPKEGVVPEEYLNIEPLRDAALRKATLPSIAIDLYDLGKKYSKILKKPGVPIVISNRGYDTMLIDGERLRRLDEMSGDQIEKDIYIAATCFVIDSKEFAYGKKEKKKALKLTLDADGYVSEKVLWPDYDSGQLNYPKPLRGAIATFFFRKKTGRKDMSIMHISLETTLKPPVQELPATESAPSNDFDQTVQTMVKSLFDVLT